VLLTPAGTADALIEQVRAAAGALGSGDSFFFTYSGHGGQVANSANGTDEDDDLDETWVCFDRQVLDDELYSLFAEFRAGVRVTVLSDSCHAGTVIRAEDMTFLAGEYADLVGWGVEEPPPARWRVCPPEISRRDRESRRTDYDRLWSGLRPKEEVEVRASVVLLGGCQDNQLSGDGSRNGVFTARLKRVWGGGDFKGDHHTFHRTLARRMPAYQSPSLFWVGEGTDAHLAARPFALPA
jgi:hypothetical protein